MKTATARRVAETGTPQGTKALLAWTPTAEGDRVAALRFSAAGALGLRLGVLVRGLPMGSVLRFSSDRSNEVFEVPAQQIFRAIQRNRDAGDETDAAYTYWSPNLGGDAVTMEIVIPADAPTNSVQIAVPQLSHVHVDLERSGIQRSGNASCEQDVACSVEFLPMSPSVALMDFIDGGDGYTCTGTLMNDRAGDGIPYFLTAAHCISTQTVASSIFTFWNFRKKTCGGTEYFAGNGTKDILTGGAALLQTNNTTDTSFLRLNDTPPPGAVFAASIPTLPTSFETVATVHYPNSEAQKVSVGFYLGTYRTTTGSSFFAYPTGSTASDADFIGARWSSGTTEVGSSGAPLFLNLNGTKYVIGQLRGGSSSCTDRSGFDVFGRFDKAFAAGLTNWLSPFSSTAKVPIHRFYNGKTGSHFYTIDAGERDSVISRLKDWKYEGASFYAYGAGNQGTQAVHRFYSTKTGSHFYTMSETEKQYVLTNFPTWKYEGIAWYASSSPAEGAAPLYRFYNTKGGTHFFTASAMERDYVINNYKEWSYEGVGYNIWPNP